MGGKCNTRGVDERNAFKTLVGCLQCFGPARFQVCTLYLQEIVFSLYSYKRTIFYLS